MDGDLISSLPHALTVRPALHVCPVSLSGKLGLCKTAESVKPKVSWLETTWAVCLPLAVPPWTSWPLGLLGFPPLGPPLPLHLKWGAMEPLRNAPQWTWVRSESWPPSVERSRYLDVIGDRWCFGAWIFLQMPSQELSRTQHMMILKTVNNYTTQKVSPYGNCGLALTVMQWHFNIGSSVLMRILPW